MSQPYPLADATTDAANADPAARLAEIDAIITEARAQRKAGGEGISREQYKALMNEKETLAQQAASRQFAGLSDAEIEQRFDEVQTQLAAAQDSLRESGERMPYDQWRALADLEKQLADAVADRRDRATIRRLRDLRNNPAEYAQQISKLGALHTYSIGNVFSFLIERDNVTRVANRHVWEERGMAPKAGERALWVNTPIFKSSKRKGPDGKWIAKIDPATGKQAVDASGKKLWEESQRRVGFKFVRGAWDISQMEVVDPHKYAQAAVADETRLQDVYSHYLGLMAQDGVKVMVAGAPGTDKKYNAQFLLHGGMGGFYVPEDKVIVLAPEHDIHQRLATLLHEVAHHSLGHTVTHGQDEQAYAIQELEAETLAHYLTGRYGVVHETADAYRASYAKHLTDEQMRKALHKVRKVAHKLHGKDDALTVTADLAQTVPLAEQEVQPDSIGW